MVIVVNILAVVVLIALVVQAVRGHLRTPADKEGRNRGNR